VPRLRVSYREHEAIEFTGHALGIHGIAAICGIDAEQVEECINADGRLEMVPCDWDIIGPAYRVMEDDE